ncbi:MAG TPA: amidase family protein [Steroidobacteraceae bacterium]|nr:amidase family protein [Steroidobacteraceae bacterium]
MKPTDSGPLLTRREFSESVGMTAIAASLPAAANAAPAASELCFLSATELAAMIRQKSVSAREVMSAHIVQIERVNPRVNAIVTTAFEHAMKEATRADAQTIRGGELGALHGLPVAHKDLVDTAGIRTTFGSPFFRDNVPKVDSPLVARTSAAGAITLGKSNTPEFGAGFANIQYGIRRNSQSV